MKDIQSIEFTVRIHFANGITLEKQVPLAKAYKLASKENVLIEAETELIEVKGINTTIIIPVTMSFVINKAPNLKNLDRISRYMLYKRDNGKCGYCGEEISQKKATIDHVVPKSRGGKTEWGNVVLACYPCNSKKDDKTLEEAGMNLRHKLFNPKKHRKINL